ncbi:hypothetical protein L916_14461 [Phytophthora nicotianae]|uniref:Uncharacterized protein n=1 Tax=Phytophthora nicotianae TaxID=4792 RepID=W2IFI8_PHYNI|nr:hypothetical protein L916_14461 [Phytophthora nicotianae]
MSGLQTLSVILLKNLVASRFAFQSELSYVVRSSSSQRI